MNMQEQLRAAMQAAQASADENIVQLEKKQTLTEEQKEFVRVHEQAHAVAKLDAVGGNVGIGTTIDDSSAVAPSSAGETYDDEPVNVSTPLPFVSVGDSAQPVIEATKRKVVKIKNLDEKAVLVQVKRRMYSPYKLDEAESRAYGAGNVNKHLFQGRDNRVKEAISKYTEVYTYVKDNTVPWATGVELLNMAHYLDFTTGLRQRIDAAHKAVDDLVANWDTEVRLDLSRLSAIAASKGNPSLANPDDYPDADEVRARFGIDVRYMPVPTADGFDPRLGISDEDKATVQQQLDDAEAHATQHVLTQMIEPMTAAAKKLSVPIGNDGSVFRDSLIDNMVDVADRMGRVNVSDDPVIHERIQDLRSLVGVYANNKDVLRNSQSVREKAATQITDLMGQMQGLV